MNYLAHIYLSAPDEDLMLGNFFGDFIRSKEVKLYPQKIQTGVLLHRQLDAYNDRHSAFKEMVNLLRPALRKYAPVALDILNDYFLSTNWEIESDLSLNEFCACFYQILLNAQHPLPFKLNHKIHIMIDHDFLMSTSTLRRLKGTMQHMDRRARFPSNFVGAMSILEKNMEQFISAYEILMVDLRIFCQERIAEFSRS